MAGKHKNWRKRWQLDAAARLATHESGLVCMLEPLPITDARAAALEADGWTACGECWLPADPSQRWGTLAQAEQVQAVFDALRAQHGGHNAPAMLARLAREAGELWTYHMERGAAPPDPAPATGYRCRKCGYPDGPDWLDGGETCPRCRLVQ